MSHSSTIRRRTTRRRRRASRIGSPPVRRLPRSVRRRSMCSPRRSRSARRVRRVGVASSQPRHQPVELRELARLERVEALAAQPLLVAGRDRHGDARARSRRLAARRRRAATPAPPGAPPAAGAALLGRRGRRAAAARCCASSSGVGARSTRDAEHLEEDGVERLHLRRVGDEHRARGPVQAPARDRPRRASSACGEARRALRRDRHARLVQAAPERAPRARAGRARSSAR